MSTIYDHKTYSTFLFVSKWPRSPHQNKPIIPRVMIASNPAVLSLIVCRPLQPLQPLNVQSHANLHGFCLSLIRLSSASSGSVREIVPVVISLIKPLLAVPGIQGQSYSIPGSDYDSLGVVWSGIHCQYRTDDPSYRGDP